MDFKAAKRMETFSQYAVAAAKEAMEQSGLDMSKEDPYRVGCSIGSGIGSLQRGSVTGDRRKVLLSCTEKAQPILKAGLEMQQNFNQKLTRNIPEEQIHIYKEIIDSMAVNACQMLNE